MTCRQANRVIQSFANEEVVSQAGITAMMTGILTCMRDPEMPVRLEAAVALRALLKDPNGECLHIHAARLTVAAVEMVRPHIQGVIDGDACANHICIFTLTRHPVSATRVGQR